MEILGIPKQLFCAAVLALRSAKEAALFSPWPGANIKLGSKKRKRRSVASAFGPQDHREPEQAAEGQGQGQEQGYDVILRGASGQVEVQRRPRAKVNRRDSI